MAKAEVALSTHSQDEISKMLEDFDIKLPLQSHTLVAAHTVHHKLVAPPFVPPCVLGMHRRLFGGYSGSNYKVVGADGFTAVLKICNSYAAEEVEAQVSCPTDSRLATTPVCLHKCVLSTIRQARISSHVRSQGFGKACTALARRGDADKFTSTAADGTPCCLLSWVDGTAADKVIAAGVPATEVLHAIGGGLAELHSVPVDGAALRTLEEGGACDVRKHVSGELLALFEESEHSRDHDYMPFYRRQLTMLQQAMGARSARQYLAMVP